MVTGGGGGIGRGICLRLGAEEEARVIVADQFEEKADETVKQVKAAGGEAAAVAVDVTDPVAVADLFDRAESVFGTASILVNCVGVSEGTGSARDQPRAVASHALRQRRQLLSDRPGDGLSTQGRR